MKVSEYIKNSSLFAGLNEQELGALAEVVVIKRLSKGQVIFLDGDTAAGFYALFEGKVRIYKSSPDGREYTIHIIIPGQLFAEVAIFEGKYFPASSIAIDDSVVGFFHKDQFLRLIEKHPKISLKIIGSLSRFLREYNRMVEDLALKEVSSRIARYLLENSSGTTGDVIALNLTKTELAKSLGTISETFSRNLRKFKDKRIINVEGQKITILDFDRLAEIAEGEKI